MIRRLAAEKAATRVPTRQECRFCEITAEDCPDRVDGDEEAGEGINRGFLVNRSH